MNGLMYHPYSIKLNELFAQNYLNYKVIDNGVNGETTSRMLERIKAITGNIKKFDLVIFYAGTNDLANISYNKIVSNIIDLHKYVLNQKVKIVHVTLPENECDKFYSFYT